MNDDKKNIVDQIESLEKLAKKSLLGENSLRTRLDRIDNSKNFIVGRAVISHIKKSNMFASELLQVLQNEVRNESELNKIAEVVEWLKESSTL